MTLRSRTRLTVSALAALSLCAVAAAPAVAADLTPVDVGFTVADVAADGFTTWIVPTNICAIGIVAAGGNGSSADESNGATRGLGAVIATRTEVTPGQQLTIAVGARGVDGRPGGAPGGGTSYFQGGGGGGGWSGVATEAVPTQANVILVAGAGGAAGGWLYGHGGNAGADAPDVSYSPAGPGGGKAGTETQGGAGGSGAWAGSAGSALAGGAASSTAGGGGAGYFGGGGGSVNYVQSGGGGGSSFPFAGSSDRLSYAIKQVTDPENGWVTISFDPRDAADTCTTPVTTATGANGDSLDGQTIVAGDVVTIEGTAWPAGEVLAVSLESVGTTLGTVTVGEDGTFRFSEPIPASILIGEYEVVLTPTSTTLATLSYGITVAAGAGGVTPQLAATGIPNTSVIVPLAAALAALLGGLALSISTRRRQRFGTRS